MISTGHGKAGEGGALPKGLSLFRFILFSFLMLGVLYGGASLYFNAPPPPGDIPPRGIPAAEWEPNVFWLPSWLALKLGIGARRTALGYLFAGRAEHALYGSASIVIGIVMMGFIGWVAGEAIRKWAVRRRTKA